MGHLSGDMRENLLRRLNNGVTGEMATFAVPDEDDADTIHVEYSDGSVATLVVTDVVVAGS